MLITLALFAAGIAMGLAGACMWAWGVKSGQFRDMEKTKDQLFWPEIAESGAASAPRSGAANGAPEPALRGGAE